MRCQVHAKTLCMNPDHTCDLEFMHEDALGLIYYCLAGYYTVKMVVTVAQCVSIGTIA